ncbi:hypothetical protein BH10CYA1_BH10CYA1_60960 [soil metagenome]
MPLMPSSRHLVIIIVLVLSTIPRCVQSASFEELEKKVIKDSGITDELPRTMPVAFTTRKIAKGHAFNVADVEERKINIDQVPADAVISCRKLVGRKSFTALNGAEVVSIQDLGFEVTESQIAGMTARDWGKFHEKMGSVCYANVAIKPGEKLKANQLVDHKMPLRIVPCDAVTHSSLVAGRICKFGCAKRHIIMQHDVF